MTRALLALADGRAFTGEACGASGEAHGEVVFNTSMTGYQEIMTDPSYRGQIVCMTYPLIGNYGINPEDVESRRPWVNGFVVKEACRYPSNWRGRVAIEDYMREQGIVGIQGIDTRALTRHLRDHGAQQGLISTVEVDPVRLADKARALPDLIGRDLVSEVTVETAHGWTEGGWDIVRGYTRPPTSRFKVVAYDSGIKRNILRQLVSLGCEVEVVPANTPAAAVLERKPHGLFLANGPGDPEAVARCVLWLLDHPVEAKRMGRQGRAAVLELFRPEHMCAVLDETYSRLLGVSSPARDELTGDERSHRSTTFDVTSLAAESKSSKQDRVLRARPVGRHRSRREGGAG